MSPPGRKFRARARILTEHLRGVNSAGTRPIATAALLVIGMLLVAPVPTPAAGRAVPTRGELELLVVLASFPDRSLRRPRADFAGAEASLFDRLGRWVEEVSSGRLRLRTHLGEAVVTLPRPRAEYLNAAVRLAGDGLRAFEQAATAGDDRAVLATAAAAVVVFAGTGRESHPERAEPPDPWSNFVVLEPPVAGFARVIVLAESEEPPFSNFGVLCHEFGHLLGLPELYAPGKPHEGIGVWGLMGQGTWLGRGDHPPHLDAWSKAQLGWIDVETVERSRRGVRVPAVTTAPRAVKIPAVPGEPREYYLLENRQRRGADAKLPGEGILVWHVDERRWAFRTAQSDPNRKLLHLVEADGRGDLDRGHRAGGNRGDAGDPWAGPGRLRRYLGLASLAAGLLLIGAVLRRRGTPARRLALLPLAASLVAGGLWLRRAPVCGPATPGMAPYDGMPGRVTLRNFSASGPEMAVDVEIVEPTANP